jgi:CRISPR-associated protein Csd2
MAELKNRYDFVYVFDVKDGNPNGDPDAGNLPRIDAETGKGLVTDVCLKRKVRNFIELTKNDQENFKIYVKEKSVLGNFHVEAFKDLGIELGEETSKEIPDNLKSEFEEIELPEGLSIEETDDEKKFLVISLDADKTVIKKYIQENIPGKELKKFLTNSIKDIKSRKPIAEEVEKGRSWMCKHFFDIRAFGAVMSLKSAPNCGQVKGPIQMTFARSVDPITQIDCTITRVAVATEKEKLEGKDTMFGRKSIIPYGLYVSYGFISANLANQTGFSEEDLDLFWKALVNMFENDRSAARGLMSARKLYVFKHSDELGNAPSNKLFELIKIQKKNKDLPARDFSDYEIEINKAPEGVEIIEKI